VLESRSAEAGAATRRRRECSGCGHRFTTYERYEHSLFVRKRSGERQPFDPAKLRGALARAAHKRPVGEPQIEAIAGSVETALRKAGGELESDSVGRICLEGLGAVDRGAYLQFAGTLPQSAEFAASLPVGSVRSKSNSLESRR
jgi:transcriptional repressor NrdR